MLRNGLRSALISAAETIKSKFMTQKNWAGTKWMHIDTTERKTTLIRTNWERTLVQISESPNYTSATENMFREVIKWTSRVFLGNTTLF
jgi:hypothetical protein